MKNILTNILNIHYSTFSGYLIPAIKTDAEA